MEILIAEDDLITRSLLKKTLLACEHSVIAVADGLQAWECLQKKTIPLVITDWAMPHMDGLDLCRKIRSAELDRYVYVVMITSRDDKKDLLTVFQAGADDYIKKPFDPDELQARIFTGIRIIERENRHRREKQDILNIAAHIKVKNQRLEAALANNSATIPTKDKKPQSIPVAGIKTGMVLAEDLRLRDGLLLLTKGTYIKDVSLRSINNFSGRGMLDPEVLVFLP